MPRYLVQGAITKEGIREALSKHKGTGMRTLVTKFIESAGGKLESVFFAFGPYDTVGIAEFPDNASAAAISVAARGAGLNNLTMTPLLTPEEMDRAVEKSAMLAVPTQR